MMNRRFSFLKRRFRFSKRRFEILFLGVASVYDYLAAYGACLGFE